MQDDSTDEQRWLRINGRRWRRTDPSLPPDLVELLTSHLGRGRSAVKSAKRQGDVDALAAARRRVDRAKHGLGERGPRWWEGNPPERLARAQAALAELRRMDLDGDGPRT